VILDLLDERSALSNPPINHITPPKEDRNREIYERYLAGESASVLACEYGISEQRVFVIIRKFKPKNRD
jgi:Mor family transcriptional regulator